MMMDNAITEADLPALINQCWWCGSQIPNPGMYIYHCSEECRIADEKRWDDVIRSDEGN